MRNAFKWDESSIRELDQRLLVRKGRKLRSRVEEAWRSSAGAERFLRAETFCERGARGGAEILVKREVAACIGGLASVDPHLRNWEAFTNPSICIIDAQELSRQQQVQQQVHWLPPGSIPLIGSFDY